MDLELIRYKQYGLPVNIVRQSWDKVNIPKPEATRLQELFNDIPAAARLIFIEGTAGPIVDQLIRNGKKVRGIDLSERFDAPFVEHNNPQCEVLLLYGMDNTVSVPKITIPMLNSIIDIYKNLGTLVIIQSNNTATAFSSAFGTKIVNKLKIQEAPEPKWL